MLFDCHYEHIQVHLLCAYSSCPCRKQTHSNTCSVDRVIPRDDVSARAARTARSRRTRQRVRASTHDCVSPQRFLWVDLSSFVMNACVLIISHRDPLRRRNDSDESWSHNSVCCMLNNECCILCECTCKITLPSKPNCKRLNSARILCVWIQFTSP